MAKKGLEQIKTRISRDKLDGVLISSVANISYLTGFNNFSSIEREAYIIFTKSNAYILTDGRYLEAVQKQVRDFQTLEISAENSLKKIFEDLNTQKIKKLGIEESDLRHKEYKEFSKYFKLFDTQIPNIRSIKEKSEIDLIEKACTLGDKTFEYLLGEIKEGISEKDLVFKLEFFVKKNGGGLSFSPIVAFGSNSSIPHHESGKETLQNKKGQFVLLDLGAKVDNYCSDMSRTIFFGKASKRQKEIYRIVKESQQLAVDYIAKAFALGKGVKASKVDKKARDYIIEKGYPTIPHSLGHGIGIEVHESPAISLNSKDYLKNGMVFSIEPGIYIPDFGGVRIEDLFVLENGKIRQLTKSPKDLIEL